jgi:hypothetical protein
MPGVYEHVSDVDIDNAVLKANGLEPRDTKNEAAKVQKCPRCEFLNSTYQKYCGRCGSALDIKVAIQAQDEELKLKGIIADALKDPKAIEEIVHTYLLMQAKKGKK